MLGLALVLLGDFARSLDQNPQRLVGFPFRQDDVSLGVRSLLEQGQGALVLFDREALKKRRGDGSSVRHGRPFRATSRINSDGPSPVNQDSATTSSPR